MEVPLVGLQPQIAVTEYVSGSVDVLGLAGKL